MRNVTINVTEKQKRYIENLIQKDLEDKIYGEAPEIDICFIEMVYRQVLNSKTKEI